MHRTVFLLTSCLVLLTVAGAAASTPVPGRQPWSNQDGASPTAVTRALEGEILEVLPDRTLMVADEYGQRPVQIPEAARIKAESKRDFDGRRKLDFADLRAGHRIKVVFLTETGEIVRLRVLREDR